MDFSVKVKNPFEFAKQGEKETLKVTLKSN